MENPPEHEKSFSEGYQGYSIQQPAQPYGAEEMPQSTYPQQGATSYSTPEEQAYSQQQYYERQPPSYPGQTYGQQQQQHYYGQQQYSQPGFGGQQQNPGQQQYYYGQQYGQQQYGQQQYAQPNARQRMAGDVGPAEQTRMGMNVRVAAVLSYLFGWIGGLVFLILERENRFVRFHAMQSVILFGAFSIAQLVFGFLVFGFFNFLGPFNMIEWGFGYIAIIGLLKNALGLFMFISWIVLLVAAGKGRYYKLPVVGDLAEKFLVKFH